MYILPGALAPLARYRQFILILLVPRVGAPGKTDKLPCDYKTGAITPKGQGGAHDPAIWTSWQEIAQIADRLGPSYGIGFVITAKDDIVCLDMDDCATESGTWMDDVQTILAKFPGAIELSNSGKGLHVWSTYQGVAPVHGKKSKGDRAAGKWLELYTELRFIALGSSVNGSMQDVTQILPGFVEQYFPKAENDDIEWDSAPDPEHTPISDEEVLRRALAGNTNRSASSVFGGVEHASFADMWNRNVEVLARIHPSTTGKEFDQSEVEFRIAKELAYWTGRDCARVANLMMGSLHKRDKWHTDVHATYFRDTVLNGVAACAAVYKAPAVAPVAIADDVVVFAPAVITHNTFSSREAMATLFEGCIYIQDNNAALLPTGDIIDQPRFKARYAGYTFSLDNENDKSCRDAWDAFLNNQVITFPRAEGTTFRPDLPFQARVVQAGRAWVNVYKEAKVARKVGDVTPFLKLLKTLLPKDDDALILLSYMAAVVQYKGIKFRWAPFVQGTQGNGKSTLTECLMHALGEKYIFSVKAAMIENHFNAWLENNILYIADDIYSTDNRGNMMEELKTLISDPRQGVTYKGIDSIQKSICGNFIFNSNHKGALKKTDDARRICTLYCAQQSKADRQRDGLTRAFFNEFYAWLNKDGFAFIADYLITMEIDSRYNPAGECQEAPDTSATVEAVIDSRTGLEHDVAEWIELEEPGFCGDFISENMLKRKLADMRGGKTMTHLNRKEMLNRLGYEQHRYLKLGYSPTILQPDGTKSILYVKRDSWIAEMTDPNVIANLYNTAQNAALTAQRKRIFNHV